MLQLQNNTPFKASLAVLPDRAGIDTLHIVIKATVHMRPSIALAPEQVPVAMADEYYGDPALSSLRVASEMHIGKPGTDVLLIGHARAPEGRPTARMKVAMSVAERRRELLVTGDRTWQADGTPSAPQPFAAMPLTWERAYGGFHRLPDRLLAEERNPVGCGFAGERSAGEMRQQPVPNLEDASAALQKVGQLSSPCCFAPVSASWLPRRSFAGTYDENWQRTRAPYLPSDFDPRFLQSAPPEFAFDRYLQGGEPVEIHGVLPDGPLSFAVPQSPLQIEVVVAGSPQHPTANLETLLIEPDENRLCMSWRATVPCDRQVLKVQKVIVGLTGRSRA
ncbi:hypothetical protein HNQ60_000801 [Povalibacter uvarum]|uniref:DUF2169 domain-containing protein n=1 Tax=Povalibacter uvarum TaxID=732238 RepID=A0A841HIS9_9GAMM|nr:DUF2169 domain-containing protein [Povalibacter uvarum]MBB6091955.1 hypothetical protein [Povalibacter uvarum]